MGRLEDNHWVDMIIDEIGAALMKVDESIQKSIELWTEFTKDIFDDQPTQDLTGQPNNCKSGEEQFSHQEPLVQVEERPLQHWSMHIDEVKKTPSEHWAMRASKIPEYLIQEQGVDDGDIDSDSDGDDDDNNEYDDDEYEYDDDDDEDETTASEEDDDDDDDEEEEDETTASEEDDDDDDADDDEEEEEEQEEEQEDETTASEEDSGSSLKWKCGYELLKNVDTSSEENDESWDDDDDDDDNEEEDEEEEDETTVSESSDNMWELNIGAWATSHSEEDSDSSWKWKGYRRLNNVVMSSEEDNESSADDDDAETRVSESSENMSELNLGASATSYITSSYHHHNEEDNWNGDYQLLKNVDTPSEEDDESWDDDDEVEECYSESVGQVLAVLRKHKMSDLSNQSFVSLDDEDDVSDEGLFPECDWVYVTRD